MALNSQFINLNKKIIACKKCKRLKNFREKIAKEKRKQYINEKYWGKPITGFGDLSGIVCDDCYEKQKTKYESIRNHSLLSKNK